MGFFLKALFIFFQEKTAWKNDFFFNDFLVIFLVIFEWF